MNSSSLFPVILSASRRTDIPAFFSKSFIQDIQKGFMEWQNPYNKKQKQILSFSKTRVLIFWTKNPQPLIPFLPILDEKNIHYYFLYTLNDYEKENFEPNLPNLKTRIKNFQSLSQLIGAEKVLWRFDPLILTQNLNIDTLYNRIFNLYNQLKFFTHKLIISFVDLHYSRSKKFAKKFNVIEWSDELKLRMAEKLQNLTDVSVATCAENLDLSQFNILHNKCIDDKLLTQLFPEDAALMSHLKTIKKDKNQREACLCVASKDIGQYKTCKYNCAYCYAN